LIAKDVVYASSDNDLLLLAKVFAPATFDLIESNQSISSSSIQDKELWKSIFSILKENGDLNLIVSVDSAAHEQVSSLLKLNGFTNVHIGDQNIQAKKP
jgi:hypothetical protein